MREEIVPFLLKGISSVPNTVEYLLVFNQYVSNEQVNHLKTSDG